MRLSKGADMRVAATSGAVALTLASAWMLYSESTTTRRLEQQLQQSDRKRERLVEDIAMLHAERAYLARPSRIEAAARAIGMRSGHERQYVEFGDLMDMADPASLVQSRSSGR